MTALPSRGRAPRPATELLALLVPAGALAVTWLLRLAVAAVLFAAPACRGGSRDAEPRGNVPDARVHTPIQPGELRPAPVVHNPHEGDPRAVNDGERLFAWYNCSGCHSPGGGGAIGPPLFDDEWIYGGDPQSIYQSIMEGRPDGMPTWGGRIPEEQAWKLVAYIRAMPAPSNTARKLRPPIPRPRVERRQ